LASRSETEQTAEVAPPFDESRHDVENRLRETRDEAIRVDPSGARALSDVGWVRGALGRVLPEIRIEAEARDCEELRALRIVFALETINSERQRFGIAPAPHDRAPVRARHDVELAVERRVDGGVVRVSDFCVEAHEQSCEQSTCSHEAVR
jgi:hypothetical protein